MRGRQLLAIVLILAVLALGTAGCESLSPQRQSFPAKRKSGSPSR